MERKTLTVEIKSADKGELEAVFSKMGEVDHEGDLTLAGAFDDGAEVALGAYAHGSVTIGGKPPVGKGQIKVVGDEARFVGQYDMDRESAREEFLAVKNLGGLLGWSYGYDILERAFPSKEQEEKGVRRVLKKVAVHEVSSTIVPAGRSTETLRVKQQGGEPPLLTLELVARVAPAYAGGLKGVSAVRFGEPPEPFLEELAAKLQPGDGFKAAALALGVADELVAAWIEDQLAIRAARLAEAKAREDARRALEAAAGTRRELQEAAEKEFEKFQRTQRRLG